VIAQAWQGASAGLSSALKLLDLSHNPLLFRDADAEKARGFGTAMADSSALLELRLAATGLGAMLPSSREQLFAGAAGAGLEAPTLTSLDLGDNELGAAGGSDLAVALGGRLGARLVCLELCGNALCAPSAELLDEEAESAFVTTDEQTATVTQLAKAIEDGVTQLKVLGLSRNGIGPQTCIALLRIIGRGAGEESQDSATSSDSNSEGEGEGEGQGEGQGEDQGEDQGEGQDEGQGCSTGDIGPGRHEESDEETLQSETEQQNGVPTPEQGVTALDLSFNAIGDVGARLIAQWLESTDRACPLRRLCLSRNRIRDTSKRTLGQVLLRAAAAEVAAESDAANRMTQLLAGGASQKRILRAARRQQQRRRARLRFSACQLGSLAVNEWDVRPLAHLAVLASLPDAKISSSVVSNGASHGASVDLPELALKPADTILLAGTIACSAHCARQLHLDFKMLHSSAVVSAVTNLNLSGSCVGLEGMRALLSAARAHKQLRCINLSNNLLGPGAWNRNRTATLSAALELLDLRDNARPVRGGGNGEEQTGVCTLNLGSNWLGAPVKKHFNRACAARTAQAVYINGMAVESGSGCACYQFEEPDDDGPLCAKCSHIRSLHKKPRLVKLYPGAEVVLRHMQQALRDMCGGGQEGTRRRVVQLHDNGWEHCEGGMTAKLRELLVGLAQCGLFLEGC